MPGADTPTVLISRPQPFAAELATQIQSRGWHPVVLGILSTGALEIRPDIKQQLEADPASSTIIFTSRMAVHFGVEQISPALLSSASIIAVGSGTAADLRKAGVAHVDVPEGAANSEAVLALGRLNAKHAAQAFVVSAPGGRGLIQSELTKRGWEVFDVDVYERIVNTPTPSVLEEIANASRLISIFSSATALRACNQMVSDSVWSQIVGAPVIVLSERLEAVARALGAQNTWLSEHPDNDSISHTIARVLSTDY